MGPQGGRGANPQVIPQETRKCCRTQRRLFEPWLRALTLGRRLRYRIVSSSCICSVRRANQWPKKKTAQTFRNSFLGTTGPAGLGQNTQKISRGCLLRDARVLPCIHTQTPHCAFQGRHAFGTPGSGEIHRVAIKRSPYKADVNGPATKSELGSEGCANPFLAICFDHYFHKVRTHLLIDVSPKQCNSAKLSES